MPKPSWSGDVSRKIVRRIVVEGDLVLQTSAHFGNGDGDDLVDMPLLTDPLDTKTPLLTGTSIVGALRSYLHEREQGFRAKVDTYADTTKSASVLLFGGNKGNEYGEQSPLIVEDARGKYPTIEDAHGKYAAIELRDGVRLAGASRTSAEGGLFNIEMWQAGTTFPLRFELIVRQCDDVSALKRALATALAGFNDGSIMIGARKRRGYGQVNVTGWRIKEYDLTNVVQLLDWIANGANELSGTTNPDIVQALGVDETITDQRKTFRLKAEFFLDGSLLIGSGSGPDIVHLHSARLSDGKRIHEPILSGTSLTGALRARAFKIAQLIAPPGDEGKKAVRNLIDDMFGTDKDIAGKSKASRVIVYEHVVRNIENKLVQNRVSLDRFTGGTRDGALFNDRPLFGGTQSLLTVDLLLEKPLEHEIGLLLLLLKDLWTGDLLLGGEISIGRGRLCGKNCHLEHQNGQVWTWDLLANEANGLIVTTGEREDLENYVTELHIHLGRSKP
jgi:CRISPR/Cas system CSM-associated protein Csm3 (group 7 of RAMP superfamily)